MLDLNMRGIIKTVFNPQNIYDGIVLGLNYMPTKHVAVATAAISSGVALYVMQPENLLNQVSVVALSSGIAWASTEAAHRIACKLWQKRLSELNKAYKEWEQTREGRESKREIEKETQELLDNLFNDPELKKVGLNK